MATPFADMFVDRDADPRAYPPGAAEELPTLLGFLRWQRQTLELKCAGLDADALARRALEPSKLSLLGLVRHMVDVERAWFRRELAGEHAPRLFRSPQEPDRDFDGAVADPRVVEEAWRAWREEIAFADRFVAAAPDLLSVSAPARPDRPALSLRWVLVHMIEEYARHNGHADVLRERIDGRVGE